MSDNTQQNQGTHQEMTEEQRQEHIVRALMSALAKFTNAPSQEMITQWKAEHDVMASGLDEDELYIWRPITRLEYKNLRQQALLQSQQASKQGDATFDPDAAFAEAIVDNCVLWASKPNALKKKAGSYEVLHEQIMLNSNFLNPTMAAQLVIKL